MFSRRNLVVSALALAGAACQERRRAPRPEARLDVKRLAADFGALAARALPGVFGLGVRTLDRDEVWISDETRAFPMQGVFRAPLAAAALAEVDAGRLKLDDRIRIGDMDLSPAYSAIDQAWPTPPRRHAAIMPAIDLIALAVQRGDNTAADVIMRRIGGPGAVTAWLRSKNIEDMRIDRYERELQQEIASMAPFRPEWKDEAAWIAARDSVPPVDREAAMNAYLSDPRDTTTLSAALGLLSKLALGDLLSRASAKLLLRLMMTTAATDAHRLIAGLPKGAALAHISGASSTDLGLTPAVGDIGIVTLPRGRRFAIAAFLAGSTATEVERDRLFADAARLVVAACG